MENASTVYHLKYRKFSYNGASIFNPKVTGILDVFWAISQPIISPIFILLKPLEAGKCGNVLSLMGARKAFAPRLVPLSGNLR